MDATALDYEFTATIEGDMGPHKWDMVRVPNSVDVLGTAKAAKVTATIDGIPVSTGVLPSKGSHLLPIKGEIGRSLGKSAGDTVTVHITGRLS